MQTLDEYMKALVHDVYKKKIVLLDDYVARLEKFVKERPKDLSEFKKHMAKLSNFNSGLDGLKLNISLDVVKAKVIEDIGLEKDKFLADEEAAMEAIDKEITELKESIEQTNIQTNKHLINSNMEDNSAYRQLEAKRKILESYSDKIFDLCAQYGITTTDIPLDESMLTTDELNQIYDEYIKYMQKQESGFNIITKFRSIVKDTSLQGVILLMILIMCYTAVLDVLSVGFFMLLGYNQISQIKKVKYYSMLAALTFNVRPEKLGFVEFDESQLLPEVLTEEIMDNDERFKKFEKMFQETIEKFEASDPDKENMKLLSEYERRLSEFTEKLNEYNRIYIDKVNSIKKDTCDEIACVKAMYEDLKSKWKFLGDRLFFVEEEVNKKGEKKLVDKVYNKSLTLNTEFVLGLVDDVVEEKVNTYNKNLIIRPSTNAKLMAKFLQVLVANVFEGVKPGNVSVTMYDSHGLCEELMPLYNADVKEYILFQQNNLSELLDVLSMEVLERSKEIGSFDGVYEFNKMCEEKGITPIPYKVVIIRSETKVIEEDEKIKDVFRKTERTGIFLWVISSDLNIPEAFIFKSPFEGVAHPINDMISAEWCKKFGVDLVRAIGAARPESLPWEDFIKVVIPDDKTWTAIADDTMNLYPGFLNGDPSSFKPFTIGNQGNVHVIGVGGTGAGKSVFLNHLIATIAKEYSPNEVELWLCDFKGTEFTFYLATEENPYMLPHIKACLCTSDGDYATSLFHALRTVADHRYDVLQTPGDYITELEYFGDGKTVENQKGTVGWNRAWRSKAKATGDDKYLANCWPRILFICDEFQVIFEKADAKNLESIKADITQIAKVGRAANVHIFFTSQSMKKTLSADILQQFTLRFALRCDKEVSQEILGTTKASDIKEKFGFLYVSATGIKKEAQPRYRTPFLDDPILRGHIKNMALLAKERGIKEKDVITYREALTHPIEQMYESFKIANDKKLIPESGVFFLGNRMAYSENRAPHNVILTAKNNTNMMCCASDTTDYVLLFTQLVQSINHNKVPGTIIINSQVADLAYLTCAEDYITRKDLHGHLLSEKVSCAEFTNVCAGLYNAWKEQKKKSPVWIFLLGWDKGRGFGIEPDSMVRNKMITLMQTAGEFNIHFIFLCSGMTGINAGTINACTYKIAAKCSVDDSSMLIGTKQASKLYTMPTGWIFVHDGTEIIRDKLYLSPITREIAKTELVW